MGALSWLGVKASESARIPVHVALPNPSLLEPARPSRGRREPGTFADSRIDWDKHGLEPRWLDDESSDCAAALDPSIFYNRGADEQERFPRRARDRGEIALVMATLGRAEDDSPRSPLATHAASINVTPAFETSVAGRRSPTGTKPKLAPEITGPDRDLGLRLLTRPPDAPWWSMELGGTTRHPRCGGTTDRSRGERHARSDSGRRSRSARSGRVDLARCGPARLRHPRPH